MKRPSVQHTLPLPFSRLRTTSQGQVPPLPQSVASREAPDELDPVYTLEFAYHSRQFDSRIRAARRR